MFWIPEAGAHSDESHDSHDSRAGTRGISGPMKIEAIDLFYVATPEIRRAADSSQDSLVVRVRADNGLIGWGECDGSPLGNLTAYVMPMSHQNIINLNEALLGEKGSAGLTR